MAASGRGGDGRRADTAERGDRLTGGHGSLWTEAVVRSARGDRFGL